MNFKKYIIHNYSRFKNIILLILIFAFLSVAFFLNYKTIKIANNMDSSIPLPESEKNFLMYLESDDVKDREEIEKKLFNEVDIQEKSTSQEKEINLGKLYYYLSSNYLQKKNILKSAEYSKKSIELLKNSNEDFYILNAYADLMNISYHDGDTITGLKYSTEIYSNLKKPNLNGISKNGQDRLSIDVLSGLLTNSSNYNLQNTSNKFYTELSLLLTQKPELETNVSIYAKYQYNLNNGNYTKAIEFAKKYIDSLKNPNNTEIDLSYFYLLEAYIFNKDFDKVPDLLKKVEIACKEKNSPIYNAHLSRIKGYYYYFKGDITNAINELNIALNKFNALEDYENCLLINGKLIEISKENNLSTKIYYDNQNDYANKFNYLEKLEALNDCFIQVAYKKIEDENIRLKNETLFIESLNTASTKVNFIYILIIILLSLLTRILDKEIKKRMLREKELKEIISTDYLTKCYSRKYILEKIESSISANEDFSILIFDLDKFKKINDTFGHNFGDIVLIKIVEAINNSINGIGHLGRLGGEEFIVILNNQIPKEIIINKIRFNISKIQFKDNLKVTISGGISNWNKKDNSTTLISKVDKLLYEAKNTGRDKIIIG